MLLGLIFSDLGFNVFIAHAGVFLNIGELVDGKLVRFGHFVAVQVFDCGVRCFWRLEINKQVSIAAEVPIKVSQCTHKENV